MGVSVEILSENHKGFSNNTLLLNGTKIMCIELYNPESRGGHFAANWPARVSTQAGLDAIRFSYLQLKSRFVEPKQRRPGIHRVKNSTHSEGRLFGEVNFYLDGHKDTIPLDLDIFLKETSLRHNSEKPNPLYWVRVDTEYGGHYFEGEYNEETDLIIPRMERIAGIVSSFNLAEPLVLFYQNTGEDLPGSITQKLVASISTMLGHLPTLESR